MLYLRTTFDAPGMGGLRNEIRATHRAYLKRFTEKGQTVEVVQAGPMCVSDTDNTNIGSFMILEAPSMAAVEEFHKGDPFTQAGIFERVELVRWDRHIGG